MRHFSSIFVLAIVVLLPLHASAGISTIVAHGDSFSPGDTIPVSVDSNPNNRTSIIVKGQ